MRLPLAIAASNIASLGLSTGMSVSAARRSIAGPKAEQVMSTPAALRDAP